MSSTDIYPLYDRAYRLTVSLPPDSAGKSDVITLSSDEFTSPLRITFDISTPAFSIYWSAVIRIYNLDQNLSQKIVAGVVAAPSSATVIQGMIVTLSAGYKKNLGILWQGPVFQATYERESVDLNLTLHCMIGLPEISRQFVTDVLASGLSQTDALQKIIKLTTSPSTINPAEIKTGQISPNIKTTETSRGEVIFGSPGKYFDQIAADNNMTWWIGHNGLNFGDPATKLKTTDNPLVFSPPSLPGENTSGPKTPSSSNNGIIVGTPQQTQQGVTFRALLDPRLSIKIPLPKIKIDNSLLRLQKIQYGQRPGVLDADGIYVAAGARFLGDSRGQEWYVEVDGYTLLQNGLLAFYQAAAQATATNPASQPNTNR